MLTKISEYDREIPIIKKTVKGENVSHRGAFPFGSIIDITVEAPRKLGASAVVLRICRDGEEDTDIPLIFKSTSEGIDIYTLELDTKKICKNLDEGLFYYEFLFLRGFDTLFTDTYNNVDFSLSERSANRFLLLIHETDFHTPKWFYGRTMYHIFVDRFFKGEGNVGTRSDAIIDNDWENGIPQYPKHNGDALSNNVFFGGNLFGVAQKLDYLKSLGVGVIYLSPIFTAFSNHKYDTGNYLEIDSSFGGEEAFELLLAEAEKRDIRIILDGVFNHTGDDSIYFDRYGKYGGNGAYINKNSPYRDWYNFKSYPNEYETWWGIKILPKLNSKNESCRDFFVGKGGVVERYIEKGISGWRLDVADELSDNFLDRLRETAKKASDGEAVIIGEVWENAAEKIAYGKRRRYLRGSQLDSVMNYPFRNGILAFVLQKDAEFLADELKAIYSTYPKCVCDSLMNILGTHDTERILTVLGDGHEGSDESNDVLAHKKLSKEEKEKAVKLLKIASAIQFTVYGVPSVFYGDEAGIEGYHDPFCRRTYPWGRENTELLEHYRVLGNLRANESLLCDGDFCVEYAKNMQIVYTRSSKDQKITVIANMSNEPFEYRIDENCTDVISGRKYGGKVEPLSCVILKA
jgi:glycosidase